VERVKDFSSLNREGGSANRSNQLFQYDHSIVPICHYGRHHALGIAQTSSSLAESKIFCKLYTLMQVGNIRRKTMLLFWVVTV
jgi:hypothetical protein